MIEIPSQVSGRRVTKRGVHLQPFGYHDTFMANADYWINTLVDMHMSWVVVLSEGDSFYVSGLPGILLDAGIIPIVRFKYQLPNPWTEMGSIEQLVNLYNKYGAPCIIQFANEPFDSREWVDNTVPPSDLAWQIIEQRWNEAATLITERGAFAGFPDGPGYTENPFSRTAMADWVWHDGKAIYLTHNYGKGRPANYPYDDVSQHGVPITEQQYIDDLDDYADDPDWNELIRNPNFLNAINTQRADWATEGITAIRDDTCFMGFERTIHYASAHFGSGVHVPMMLTEGGWTPRDIAGSNPIDIRWPYTTPKMVARKTLKIIDGRNTPFLAICPWLLADGDLGGSGAWEFDAWIGWAYNDKYGREKPVVQTLMSHPPDVTTDIDTAIRHLSQSQSEMQVFIDSLR